MALLGPVASGKSTQAALLSAKFDVPIVSPGDLVQAEMKAGTELGIQAKEALEATKTVPEHVYIEASWLQSVRL